MKYFTIFLLFVSFCSYAMEHSDTPSITKDQAKKLLKEHKFNKEELAYRAVFLNYETSLFDKIIDSVYDPNSSGTTSSKEAIKEAFVECNVYSYRAYSPELRSVPFKIALEGGSYPDTKMAFDAALAKAVDDPNIGKERVLNMVQGAGNIIKVCTDNHGMRIFP